MRDEALLVAASTSPGPETEAPTQLELFVAILLRRPAAPLDDEARTVVAWAGSEAARWVAVGRETAANETRLAYRFAYKMLRDRAVSADPELSPPEGSRWERVLWATCGLRHRQRAALALRYCASLTIDDVAAVLGVGVAEARKVIDGAIAAVARTVGEPVDVKRSLRVAGQRLAGSSRTVITLPEADPSVARMPRAVIRNWITAPVQEGGLKDRLEAVGHRFPPPRAPIARRSPVETLLAEAEAAPADMGGTAAAAPSPVRAVPSPAPAAPRPAPAEAAKAPKPPKPPKPDPTPVAEPVLARARPPRARAALDRRRHGRRARAVLAVAAVVAVVAALMPASARDEAPPSAPAAPRVAAHRTESVASRALPVVVVRPGDSLWVIAERRLGAGDEWRAIWRLNRGRSMPDGVRFTDPDLIMPRWRLRLPRAS